MKSKFSISQTIIIPAILFFITFGLAGLLVLAGSRALIKSDNGGFLLLLFGAMFLSMSLLIMRHYFKQINQIELDLNEIRIQGLFKNKVIKWTDVKEIVLTGKEFEKFMFSSMPMEAISILSIDGDREIFFVKHYSNMDRIRTALHFIDIKIEKHQKITSECFYHVQRKVPKIQSVSGFEKFGGNHFLTFNGLISHGSIIFVFWLFLFSNSPMTLIPKIVLSIVILLFGLGLYGYQLHYFRLNKELLVIKNHIWLWQNDNFLIKDLREVVFEEPHKLSTSLRVITNNYETKLYPAGSIRNRSWRRLSEEFEKMGITVRNEAFFE